MTELSERDLNRATLARQLLLERAALRPVQAVERLCALQAQAPTGPHVALWSRVRGFDRATLTRARNQKRVVRGTLMRVTLHLLSTRDYVAYVPLFFGRRDDPEAHALRAELAGGTRTWAELARAIPGATMARWPALPMLHLPPAGDAVRWS